MLEHKYDCKNDFVKIILFSTVNISGQALVDASQYCDIVSIMDH